MADARRRAAKLLVKLALVGEPRTSPDGCVICASSQKADSGECANCGVYICGECGLLHYGPPPDACPGSGVPLPRGAA